MVNIKDEDAHGLKVDVKEGYGESNQLFYSVLRMYVQRGKKIIRLRSSMIRYMELWRGKNSRSIMISMVIKNHL